MPMPPVIFVISDCASALPCSIAPFTPLNTTSSRNSTSFGSTITLSILIETTLPAPFATTFTWPPPACTSTVFSSSSACVLAICSCIFCACFINLLMFMASSGFDLSFEQLKRFANERVVLNRFGARRSLLFCGGARAVWLFGLQSLFQAAFDRQILFRDLVHQCLQEFAISLRAQDFHLRSLCRWKRQEKTASLFSDYVGQAG